MDNIISPIVIAVAASIIFELIKYFFFNKRPILIHELGNAVTYKIEGSKNYFSTLSIKNKGKKTAKNLSVSLKTDSLEQVEVEINSNEINSRQESGEKTFFQFERLLSKDKIELVFRKVGSKFTPDDLIIRSDEIESKVESDNDKSPFVYFLTTLISISIPVLTFYISFKSPEAIYNTVSKVSNPIELTYEVPKNISKTDKETPFSFKIKNKGDDLLRDIQYVIKIPGTTYRISKEEGFINPGETFEYKGSIKKDIMNEIPPGTHKLNIKIWSETFEDSYFLEDQAIFEIKNGAPDKP